MPVSGAQPGIGPRPSQPGNAAPLAPTPCVGVPSLNIACARLAGVVGPENVATPYTKEKGWKKNDYQDVLLVQKLINKVVNDGYVANSVLGGGENGKLATPLPENGLPSPALWNAIKQIELLYFHGRANPHGIAVIDPQADESLFTFLVELANRSHKRKNNCPFK